MRSALITAGVLATLAFGTTSVLAAKDADDKPKPAPQVEIEKRPVPKGLREYLEERRKERATGKAEAVRGQWTLPPGDPIKAREALGEDWEWIAYLNDLWSWLGRGSGKTCEKDKLVRKWQEIELIKCPEVSGTAGSLSNVQKLIKDCAESQTGEAIPPDVCVTEVVCSTRVEGVCAFKLPPEDDPGLCPEGSSWKPRTTQSCRTVVVTKPSPDSDASDGEITVVGEKRVVCTSQIVWQCVRDY
ncbi:MAG: hypothetical protein H6923_02790 [Alphaproteobacteria bacterium]|nr:hypothetical protein [Alphaproteobacteria bacterium]